MGKVITFLGLMAILMAGVCADSEWFFVPIIFIAVGALLVHIGALLGGFDNVECDTWERWRRD